MRTGTKLFRYIVGVLYIILAFWLAYSAIKMCRDGIAVRESADILADIYTRESVGERLAPMAPLFFVTIGMTLAGLFLEVADEGGASACKKAINAKAPGVDAGADHVNRADHVNKASAFHNSEKSGGAAKTSKNIRLTRTIIMIAALCMILAGIVNGSARDVLIKAVNLCTECVGLG